MRVLLVALALCCAAVAKQHGNQDTRPSAWISDGVHPHGVDGRPLVFENANSLRLQRVSLGAITRDSSAKRFDVPHVGQYLVRVSHPVRKNLAVELRALAVGPVRYLPHDTFTAVLPAAALSAVTELEGVVDLFVRPAESKVGHDFSQKYKSSMTRRSMETQEVTVVANLVEVPGDKDWPSVMERTATEFQKALGAEFEVSLKADTVEVVTDMGNIDSVVSLLAAHPLTLSVQPEGILYPFSLQASEAVQSGSGASEHRIWDKGLLGDGEIVAVLDSGCDFDMAFFVDSSQSIATCGADVAWTWEFDSACVNLDHRKIVSYRFTGGPSGHADILRGHGTHVASTVAGQVDGDANTIDGTGACPNCKLVIDDLDDHDGPEGSEVLYTASNFNRLMQHSYNAGARIHSISAGKMAGNNFYGNGAQGFDEFQHANDDSLIVSAAGNYGAGNAEFSIVDPASAKNSLTVGMTNNGRPSAFYNEDGTNGGSRVAFGAGSNPDSSRLFVQFRMDEWEAFRAETPHQLDRNNWDFSDTSDTLGNYYASPRLEVREVNWGRALGNNEVVAGPLVSLSRCMCTGEVDRYPYDDHPSEPWTLIVLWDWGYSSSVCARDCSKATAWANIMELYNNHGMGSLLLIEPKCTQGTSCSGLTADDDQWWVLEIPSGYSEANRAPFPIGQVMQEGTAIQAYIGADWYWYYYMRDYYFDYYSGDASYAYIWDDLYYKNGGEPPGMTSGWTDNMHVVWPHDRRSYLYSLSSRGPTLDLRFVPDVVCPGGDSVRAAMSDGSSTSAVASSDTTLKTGTSMATPVCSGSAALVRQYLREGWYGDGTAGSAADVAAPSGALLKAMMIHSAQPVYGTEVVGGQWGHNFLFPSFPNFHAGWGRLSLDHVLMFEDSAFSLLFGDRVSMFQSGATEICVTVADASQPLVATIVWMDPAAEQLTHRALINDLDLVVVSEAGEFYYGNNIMWTDEVNTGGRVVRDSRNNVEKVKIDVPTAGKYSIRIAGTDVPDGPQNFAWVVTGVVSEAAGQCGALAACENDCSGRGICLGSGMCVCDAAYSGTDCSFENQPLSSSSYQVEIDPTSSSFYTIDASDGCYDLVVDYTVTQGQADVLIAESVHPVDYGSAATPSDGLNSAAGCLQHASYRVSSSDGLQRVTINAATQATYVMSVTGVVDPNDGEYAPTKTATIVTASFTKTASAGCSTTLCPGASAAAATPPPTTPPPSNCPAQDASYAACALGASSWEEITAIQLSAPAEIKTGGLGSNIMRGECEVWVCAPSSRVTGCAGLAADAWLCFWYNEQTELFLPWGTNDNIGAF